MSDFYDNDDDDVTFDCPECGAAVYEDSPRCPRCGEYVTNKSFSGWPKSRLAFVVIVLVLVMLMLLPFFSGLF